MTDTAARGVVAYAKTTEAYVIAEGIEDPDMLESLRRLGLAEPVKGTTRSLAGVLVRGA